MITSAERPKEGGLSLLLKRVSVEYLIMTEVDV